MKRETLKLILLSIATWRVSSLLVNEPGPGDVFEKLRYAVGVRYDEFSEKTGTNLLSSLFTCIWCMSVWVGFGFMLFGQVMRSRERVFYAIVHPLVFSSFSIWFDKLVNKK